MVQETPLKTEYKGKLVEISAEEKKSVEMQEVTGYHLRREDSRGRKQEGKTRRVERRFVE